MASSLPDFSKPLYSFTCILTVFYTKASGNLPAASNTVLALLHDFLCKNTGIPSRDLLI